MKQLLFLPLVLWGCSLASAQYAPTWKQCSDVAGTQAELNDCASKEAKREDKLLDEIYGKLVASVSKDAKALDKVRAAERAWIAYRDAYLSATYPADDKQTKYGSMFTMEWDLLYAQLTEEHIRAVQQLLDEYHSAH